MRAFLWVSGILGAGIAVAFAIALLREPPSARVALPPALLEGETLADASATEAFRAWAEALPPAPVPLTTRYELRSELQLPDQVIRRGAADLTIVNGNLDSLRLDVLIRSSGGDAESQTFVDGSIVLEGSTFWAWGSLPTSEEFEKLAHGKVVRLPTELLSAFFQEGMFWLEDLDLPRPAGMDPDAEMLIGKWFHPARLAGQLMRGGVVTGLSLEDDVLRVTLTGGVAAMALLSRVSGELAPELSVLSELPLFLRFDADTGELRSGECQLADGVGFFRITRVHREAAAPASAFRYPEGLAVFDLAPLAQMGLGLLRRARAEQDDAEF